jgi:hypothetical protein
MDSKGVRVVAACASTQGEGTKMNATHDSDLAGQRRSLVGISRLFGRLAPLVAVLTVVSFFGGGAVDARADDDDGNTCTRTARVAFTACYHDAQDNFWIAIGNCINESDSDARGECIDEAKSAVLEERKTCSEQRAARLEVCGAIGEAPYDPKVDPAKFVDPAEIGKSVAANPYLPLLRGRTWVYRGGTQTNTVTVTNDTRTILGVECVVVRDVVEVNGQVIEDTKDWYAQDIDGNVWYFGEIAQEFEDGELVNIDGSWTAGTAGAKPGFAMKAAPLIGAVYRQEFSLGNAEDMAEVLSLTGAVTVPAGSCKGNCLITKEFAAIEPDAEEQKYYLPGVGQILTVDTTTGARIELIEVKDQP